MGQPLVPNAQPAWASHQSTQPAWASHQPPNLNYRPLPLSPKQWTPETDPRDRHPLTMDPRDWHPLPTLLRKPESLTPPDRYRRGK